MPVEPTKVVVEKDMRVVQLLGCVFYGDPFHSVGGWDTENEIGLTWKRFMKLYRENQLEIDKVAKNPDIQYEVHIEPDDFKESKKFYVFAGLEVKKISEPPLGMFPLVLPETRYAIFSFKGKDMMKGGDYIWNVWLPDSEYQESHPFVIQAYDGRRFKGLQNGDSELDWMVPIKSKK
jgi:AraC family transcriptional regulator